MKEPEEIAVLPIFDEILAETSQESKLFVQRSLAIANQVVQILDEKNMKQKDLADLMGKKEAEVSRWLSGFHNFTIKSLTKIEAVLGEQIISTPSEAKQAKPSAPQEEELYKELIDSIAAAIKKSLVAQETMRSQMIDTYQKEQTEVDYVPSASKLRIVA